MSCSIGDLVKVESVDGELHYGHLVIQNKRFVTLVLPRLPRPDWHDLPEPARPPLSHSLTVFPARSVAKISTTLPSSLPPGPSKPANPSDYDVKTIINALGAVDPREEGLRRKRESVALERRSITLGFASPAGSSAIAQAIFAGLSKTLPCAWRQDQSDPIIVVMDEIIIGAPYTPNDCRGTIKTPLNTLERVKKVLQGERIRLGLN